MKGFAVNRIAQSIGSQALQLNFRTTNIEIGAVTGQVLVPPIGYPILNISANTRNSLPSGFRVFKQEVIILALLMSTTFHSAAAAETACIAVSRFGNAQNINALGDTNMLLQQTYTSLAADTGGISIKRDLGVTFAPPFFPVIAAGDGIALFGSAQASLDWYCLCTVYYLLSQEFSRFQAEAE